MPSPYYFQYRSEKDEVLARRSMPDPPVVAEITWRIFENGIKDVADECGCHPAMPPHSGLRFDGPFLKGQRPNGQVCFSLRLRV